MCVCACVCVCVCEGGERGTACQFVRETSSSKGHANRQPGHSWVSNDLGQREGLRVPSSSLETSGPAVGGGDLGPGGICNVLMRFKWR